MLSKIKKISKLKIKNDRYNLEVKDNNNYFANNILVHNCCCLAMRDGNRIRFMSRQGTEFTTLQHIEDSLLRHCMADWEIYHGELYSHELTFQDIVSAVKRDDRNLLSDKIQFWIYDLVRPDWDYEERYDWLRSQKLEKYDNIKVVHSFIINSHEDVIREHKKWTSKGFEGIMLRNLKGGYEIDKRSKNLQKVKRFFDMEFPIIGAEPCKGKMEGMCSFVMRTTEGATFKAMPEGDEFSRRNLYSDYKQGKLTGKSGTVRFFSWTDTNPKVPRFPILQEIR
jgi:ATP-dependent DNA ligase